MSIHFSNSDLSGIHRSALDRRVGDDHLQSIHPVRSDAIGQTASAPNVVHLTGDFPDPILSFKTTVIRDLVDLTRESFSHDVISLNRRSPALAELARQLIFRRALPSLHIEKEPFEYGTALKYFAPGRGILHASLLHKLGDILADRFLEEGIPDLLVGHKLSIEGIAVRRAAHRLGIPFAICIQGDTDTKIIKARPDLRIELRRIFHEAAMVFSFAPWATERCKSYLGPRRGPVKSLPCPTELDVPLRPQANGRGIISIFHLKNYRRKNLAGLTQASAILASQGIESRVSVIGGGQDREFAICRKIVGDAEQIMFEGSLDRAGLQQRMNRAIGFALPSFRESFGLVFIEALFAGLPIVYPKGCSIEGYFDGYSFAIPVDANNPKSIADGMAKLIRDEAHLKADLLGWQTSAHAKKFTRTAIASDFSEGLTECL